MKRESSRRARNARRTTAHSTPPALEQARPGGAPGGHPGRRLGRWCCAVTALGLVVTAAMWFLFPYSTARLDDYPASTYLLDRHGEPLRMLLGPGDLRCDPIDLDTTGEWAWKALVAVEDKRFFEHPGLDALAIARAMAQNTAHRRVISGASTLSSQVIRMTESRPRTMPSKVVEGFRALQMDAQLDKPEILTQYLNRAPMGGNLEGVAAASHAYFGKDPIDLSLSEAALLMGLPQSPSRFRPTRHPERARKRRHAVLLRMLVCGYITPEQFQAADQEPVLLAGKPAPFRAPHFCELARSVLAQAPRPSSAGHRVSTTLDSRLQQLAEDALGRQAGWRSQHGVNGGAVVILEVASGAIRALVGSPDFFAEDGQVNGAVSERSPGSALKPFAYALAMDRGLCTPDSMVSDRPMTFKDYRPENFDRTFAGTVTIRQALVRSLNIPALRMTREVGLDRYLKILRNLGLKTIDRKKEEYGISLALGTTEVTLLDLATAYGALARGGEWLPYQLWEAAHPSPGQHIFSEAATYLVTDVLEENSRLVEVRGHAADTRAPPVAWKTGTSSGRRDAWAVAYNPDYVVGIWIGNPSGRGAEILTGATAAAPIAYSIFRSLYPDGTGPWFERPITVRPESICPLSGFLPGPQCTITVDGLRIPGVSDPRLCDAHDPRSTPEDDPRIVSPVNGARYRVVNGIPADQQSIALIAHAGKNEELYWFVDGRHLGAVPAGSTHLWPLVPGTHTLACTDRNGRSDTISIVVQ